jgi:hypothetical protein
MKNLQEATERICELKGSLVAVDVLLPALVAALPLAALAEVRQLHGRHAEAARTALLHVPISEHSISAFEREVLRTEAMLDAIDSSRRAALAGGPGSVLLAITRVLTFAGDRPLTTASGFFFERHERLYLVTSRHVLFDGPMGHAPDRIEIDLHTDAQDLTRSATLSILLYRDGTAVWRQAEDGGGAIDVAVIELQREALPGSCVMHSFGPRHIPDGYDTTEVGDSLAIAGFPPGFHDTVHHLPVVRQAAVASSYGIRFQGKGYFLTDGRTHRGSSGAPVLRRRTAGTGSEGWSLLGVHSSRLDMRLRDAMQDESLGLNCAWYSDILLTLTGPAAADR